MAVGKRQIGSLTVPVRGHVPPLIGIAIILRRHSKMRVQHRVFVLVNEDQTLRRVRPSDLGKFIKIRNMRHQPGGGIAVDGLAQVVTAVAHL